MNLEKEEFWVIKNINIVDVLSGGIITNQTMVIKDSRIEFIGSNWKHPSSSKINTIDARNKYIIPGMWDMHFHLSWNQKNDSLLFPVLFSKGITGIRDMGGDLKIQNTFKSLKKAKPEIYGAGPIIDGNPPVMYDFTVPVDQNTEIEKILDSISQRGADFIKTYSLIRKPEFERIAAYSEKNNIPFAGHLSEFIEPELSIDLGQKSIEHLNRLDKIWEKDPTRINDIARAMIKNDTWLCPTLLVYFNKMVPAKDSLRNESYDRYIAPELAREWEKSKTFSIPESKGVAWQAKQREFEQNLDLVSFLHKKGIKIVAGSDFGGMPYVYPGIGLLQELKLLKRAGLSNLEVIRTATINPALYFSIDEEFGSVSVGKFADLVILKKNPLIDIENLKSIEIVFKKGELVYHHSAETD
ncbi:MAG: amidohydrolase family protein [Salegentibacter mishustinae]|nr:amidohydrolase family protein [Salegentibacter mishustinae]